MNWKPIETAPRDGTWFRAKTSEGVERVVHFEDYWDRFPIFSGMAPWLTEPIYWCELE